jgi:hypothetical protein
MQADLILEFGEQGFHFLSLPLCLGELGRLRKLPCALSGWFVLMDDQASESRTRALRSERARATPFAGPDVGPRAIATTLAAIVQRLASRADIAIVFRFVRETLGSEVGTPLSVDTVAGPHIGSDAAIG